MRLEGVDELFLLTHGEVRSLDCIFAINVAEFPDNISERADRAQEIFRKTSMCPVEIKQGIELSAFINEPLKSHYHLSLALIEENSRKLIALKMSHLLGDAVSMILWLKALLGEDIKDQGLKQKAFPSKKDTSYRFFRNSVPWRTSIPGRDRRFIRFRLGHEGMHCLNDALVLSLLNSLDGERKSIWLPVNVRENFWEGFGNGLSRMRIYPLNNGNIKDKLKHINKQKREAWTSGEVFVAPSGLKISGPVHKAIINMWIKRPWADWGSISLSHVKNDDFMGAWGISNIMPQHQGAMFVYSKKNESWVTLTYDAHVPESEAQELVTRFQKNFREIKHDLLT